jgi:uncharacterized OB-fold protein
MQQLPTKNRIKWNKPVPSIDSDHLPFWNALKEHKFFLFRCGVCNDWYWPVSFCKKHANEPLFGNMTWQEASGKGEIFSFNISYRAFHPGFVDDVPFVYAAIKLDEGPIMSSNIVGCDPKEVKIGLPVQVVFQDAETNDGYQFTIPWFKLGPKKN